jgi:hypothetical protein
MKISEFRQQLITEVRRLVKEAAMRVSRDELVKIIKTTDPRNSGKGEIFTVTFVKKDGTTRVMNARLGVKRYLRGGSLPYDPIAKGLLPVYDLQKNDYRMINLNTIISAKVGGQDYIAG